MNLNHLHYFHVLGEYQHYGKAAEALHITQPGLSQIIAKLENELGVVLFEKKGRNIVLTKIGLQFWNRIHYAFKELELAENELTQSITGMHQRVDIGFTFALGSSFIPKLMKDFLNSSNSQDISLTTLQGDSPEIINAIKNRVCDVGFCSYFNNEPDLEFIPIFCQDIVLIVPDGHVLCQKPSIICQDLLPYPFVAFKKNHALYAKINQAFESQGLLISPAYEVTEETTMAGLVAANLGIALIPDSPLLDHFQIKKLKVQNALSKRYLYMCYLKNYYQTPAIQAFIEFTLSCRRLAH